MSKKIIYKIEFETSELSSTICALENYIKEDEYLLEKHLEFLNGKCQTTAEISAKVSRIEEIKSRIKINKKIVYKLENSKFEILNP